jgi:predicted RNA-binding protein with PUA-like domain
MNYWLMKSEPEAFSIDDLKRVKVEPWDGVRNFQARNMLRDDMAKGDLAFFYHSNCQNPGIVGIMEIARAGYPDPTAFDPEALHYDPQSDPDNPRWYLVDVRYRCHLNRIITLQELKEYAEEELHGLPLLRRGNRLSVLPVTETQWEFILSLE